MFHQVGLVLKVKVMSQKKGNRNNVCQYSDNCLSFCFFWCGSEAFSAPEYLVYGEKLSNIAVVPSKLKTFSH
jgi:hypothetical protein